MSFVPARLRRLVMRRAAVAQFIRTHAGDVGLPNDWQDNYDIAVLATMMGVPKEDRPQESPSLPGSSRP
jgi:ATP-dependent Lon protease